MPAIQLSAPQFAAKMNCSRQAVTKAIRAQEKHPQKKQPLLKKVASYSKVGNSYVLTLHPHQ